MQAFMNSLSPGYFETMGIPMLEGRDFDAPRRRRRSRDGGDRQPALRRALLHGQERHRPAPGLRAAGPSTKLTIEIVGVVADSLYEGPREGVRRQVFVPNWGNGSATFYVRAAAAIGIRVCAASGTR